VVLCCSLEAQKSGSFSGCFGVSLGRRMRLDGDMQNSLLSTVLNVIWLVFGGLWLALGYFLAGIVCCLLIVTIPFGIASFRIAAYALWPFGRTIVDRGPTPGMFSTIGNVIWI